MPIIAGGDQLVFGACGGAAQGYEAWITDGTEAGTSLLLDSTAGAGDGFYIISD
jgi:ELWxxDGT repeat protein